MAELVLGDGHIALIDDEDVERVTALGIWTYFKVGPKEYAKRDIKPGGVKKTILLHRFIMEVHDLPGNSAPVDHEDHNGLNNQKCNLKLTTKRGNLLNRKNELLPTNTSGVRGVYWSNTKQKWHAEIMINKRKHHIGFFDRLEDAKAAYQQVELTTCRI